MLRSILFALVFLPVIVLAQQPDTILAQAGWYPLPDSLFLIWKLDADQIRRLKVVEEDHEAERAKVMADMELSIPERDERLRRQAAERRNDVRSVIGGRFADDWYMRLGVR
jgi:hypothetical protein